MLERIEILSTERDEAAISRLGGIVKKLSLPSHRERPQRPVFEAAQSTLLSIPGHARYFADELERLRLDPKSDYWRMRQWYLAETLKHLPSPETIQVLGHYLDDERDLPRDRIPGYKEFVESLEKPPEFQIFPPENARLAVYALSRIGLRDAPCPVISSYSGSNASYWEGTLPKCREWYAKVKSGELAFSFVGGNVEYRFKPDGTWETIPIANPPDDAPQPAQESAMDRSVEKPEPVRADPPQPSLVSTWWWLGICGSTLLVLGTWFRRKKMIT